MNLAASLCRFRIKTQRKIALKFTSVKTFHVFRAETGYELEVKGCLVGHFLCYVEVQTGKYNRHCTQTM